MRSRPARNRPHRQPLWPLLMLLVALAAFIVAGARDASKTSDAGAPVVHAERAGLRLGMQALTGRVALVASRPATRWRIAGLTGWRRAGGRLLVAGWDTTGVADGAYRLELETAAGPVTQALSVRNSTPLEGSPFANASAGLDTTPDDGRAVVAVLSRRSYRPRDVAVLELWGAYPGLRIQLLHIGPEKTTTAGNETIRGVPVGNELRVAGSPRQVRIRVAARETGLYAYRLAWRGRTGFAPFVVRPARLGRSDVAVVQPTLTWQAYNYRCANGDGIPDTWYYRPSHTTVDQSRPYLDRGVPPHFRQYDLGFLHWLVKHGKRFDMLAQEDLEQLSGERLARLYRLIVFPGHHEYVTTREYDAVQRYRDLGGNLAFLSANNFFYRVDRHGDRITRIGRWRDLGRPEAALVGVQYFQWNLGTYKSRQYGVHGTQHAPWLFEGTGIRNGDRLGWWGIEVDGRTAASPRSIRVLASYPNAFGTGRPAEMTYYETPRGARVFAAGAFTLGGDQAHRWTTGKLLENLWEHLAGSSARRELETTPR
jgi:hypothetical protein